MDKIENKLICLSLNNAWQPIGQKTVKEAICALVAGDFIAIDIQYPIVDGEPDFQNPIHLNPVKWEEWLSLPIRDYDFVIRSTKLTVRVPTVIIALTYSKMPLRKMRLSINNIRIRDKNTCQYTGKKLSTDEGSVDHIKPKCLGGTESWENLVFCDRKINLKKGGKPLKDSGFKLAKQPQEPPLIPAFSVLREAKHKDWKHFIIS